MLRTPLCDLLGVEVPIICAPFGPWEQVELAAAVCAAGGLGSVGTALQPVAALRDQWARLRELTDRPFAINHTMRPFDPDAFEATLRARPAMPTSFARRSATPRRPAGSTSCSRSPASRRA